MKWRSSSPRCRQTRAGAAPCPWSKRRARTKSNACCRSPPAILASRQGRRVLAGLVERQKLPRFDLTDLWTVGAIARDMLATAAFIATLREYRAAYGLRPQFEQLVTLWRPALAGTGDV